MNMTQRTRNTIVGYLFLTPSLIGYVVFLAFPIVFSLIISFTNWDLISGLKNIKFVGFDNFIKMYRDVNVTKALKNNIIFAVTTVPMTIFIALFFAVLLNNKIYCKRMFRLFYFIPYITSITAVSVVWLAMFNPSSGPINTILRSIGVAKPPAWISSPHTALLSIIIVSIWMGIGFCMVLYLAALQNIPVSYYEAAELDGTTELGKFIHITLPLLSSTTFMLFITRLITSFEVFGIISVMTGGGPVKSTTVLVYEIYIQSFQYYKFGYASAIAWLLFFIIFTVTVLQWVGQKKWVHE